MCRFGSCVANDMSQTTLIGPFKLVPSETAPIPPTLLPESHTLLLAVMPPLVVSDVAHVRQAELCIAATLGSFSTSCGCGFMSIAKNAK